LFSRSVDAVDLSIRKRVGFMSQAFSLYSELTVRQNLALHARLYHLPKDEIPKRVIELIARFSLTEHENDLAAGLPLGIRQRLSLAVAVIHGPEILILDEPTSGMEIRRDPIRLAFALLGPLILMVVFGYGISFDVDHLPYAVLDRDQMPESRTYLESYAGSHNFDLRPPILDAAELERRMRTGELKLAIEIPSDFGRDLKRGRRPEVGVWVDGAMPFRAESSRGYAQNVHLTYLAELARRALGVEINTLPVNIETRFRYNQDFKSVFAMVPGVIMLLLMLIPAMMTAVGVVREKELGSITNLYATPVTRLEFLTGKQLPYVAVAFLSFLSLVLLALCLFQVPLKGGFVPLAAGALLYVAASTGFGLLVSTFVRTQIAALFAAAVLSLMPTINFSGMLTPVSSLSAGGRLMGYGFPSAHFQKISIGAFTKALGFGELWIHYLALAGFTVGFLLLALVLLKTQEI